MKSHIICRLVVLIFLLLLLTAHARARNNGIGDKDLNLTNGTSDDGGPNCGIGCHINPSSGGIVSISSSPVGPYTTGKTGIDINATFSNFTVQNNNELGIMLVNNTLQLSGNIKNDGWNITQDPNSLAPYENYNERKNSGGNLSYNYNWTLTTPGMDGTY